MTWVPLPQILSYSSLELYMDRTYYIDSDINGFGMFKGERNHKRHCALK